VKHRGSLFAGVDWASKTHAVCLVDDTGQVKIRFEIPNTGKTFTGLVKRLAKLNVSGVAIERCDRAFPGAVGRFARLDSDVAIAFLRRYPTQHAASRLTQA
jgi:hypothetical protein